MAKFQKGVSGCSAGRLGKRNQLSKETTDVLEAMIRVSSGNEVKTVQDWELKGWYNKNRGEFMKELLRLQSRREYLEARREARKGLVSNTQIGEDEGRDSAIAVLLNLYGEV